MRIKINLKSVLVYCTYALATLFAANAVPGVPLALGLCFGMLICGANIAATPIIYTLTSIATLDWVTMLLSVFEGGFACIVTLLYRRSGKKIRAEAAAYIAVALAPFVAFSRWSAPVAVLFTDNEYIIRAIAAIAVILFSFFCIRCVYSLIFRLFRCMLRPDELLCIAVVACVCGTGIYNAAGKYAYLCLCAGAIPLAVRLCRSSAAMTVALVLSLPAAIALPDIAYASLYVLLAAGCLVIAGGGRGAPSALSLVATGTFLYFDGAFTQSVGLAAIYILLLVCCCLAATLPSDARLTAIRRLMQAADGLTAARQSSLKESVSRRLFRMSEVFREIELAFTSLDEGIDEGALKRRMLTEVKEGLCSGCDRKNTCAMTSVYSGIAALIETGCAKGRVSLVDLPREVSAHCTQAGALLDAVNRNIAEYRKLTLENDNVKSGRKLLAGQAKGIAEVLKCHAVEIARRGEDCSALETAVAKELAACGISCSGVKLERGEVSRAFITVAGKVRADEIAAILKKSTGMEFMLKEKTALDAYRYACVFIQPPRCDAAFGVAFAVKDGESVSGDTHSVISINEHSFLMALSDGMGSGIYARKVSSTAISLIEAFYRAEMPPEIVLDTINKLLCFNREERFACIDVCAIDLNSLSASFIKIGSPAGVIVRKGEIKVLESNSLPLGILDNLHPTTCAEQLKCDDIVVFMSDGVTSAFSTPQELYEYLRTLRPLNPQSLADDILNEAKDRQTGIPDDMTVLCVRLFERAPA